MVGILLKIELCLRIGRVGAMLVNVGPLFTLLPSINPTLEIIFIALKTRTTLTGISPSIEPALG